MTTPAALRLVLVGGALLLLANGPAWAHHSYLAQFDSDKPITLQGTLTRLEWKNPHGWIHMAVKGTDGRVEQWAIETGAQSRMQNRGLKRSDFQPGIELVVSGFAARDGSRKAAGWTVVFPRRGSPGPEANGAFLLGR